MLDVECYCTLARRAARALSDRYDAALADSGLKATQYGLLRMIERLDQPSLTVLAEATGLDRSTLGRNLKVLERTGLVALSSGRDGRVRVARLTDAARQALRAARPLWQQAQADLARTLPPDTRQVLRDLGAAPDRGS